MNYFKMRAWFGVFTLVFWVGVACAGLFYEWPSQMFPAEPSSIAVEATWWALIVAAYVLVMLPLDLVGGYLLPRWSGRQSPPFFQFWQQLLRGIGLHAVVLFLSGLLIMEVGKLYGTWGVMALLMSFCALLLLA